VKLINLWAAYSTFDCPTAQKLVLAVPFNHGEGEGLIGVHQNCQSMLDLSSIWGFCNVGIRCSKFANETFHDSYQVGFRKNVCYTCAVSFQPLNNDVCNERIKSSKCMKLLCNSKALDQDDLF